MPSSGIIKENKQNPNMSNLTNKPHVIPSQIDLKNTEATICESCSNPTFQEAAILRKVSALVSGTGREGFLPINVFACMKCGGVNDQFLPVELRKPKLTV